MLKAFTLIILTAVVVSVSGCLVPIHQTEVRGGDLKRFDYDGPTALFDMADIRAMNSIAEAIEHEVQWWPVHRKEHEGKERCSLNKSFDLCFSDLQTRLRGLKQELSEHRRSIEEFYGFEGTFINDLDCCGAKLKLLDLNNNPVYTCDFNAKDEVGERLLPGTYTVKWTAYLKGQIKEHDPYEKTISGPRWIIRLFAKHQVGEAM